MPLSLSQLESFLWAAADILRGNMDASEYKNYIFSLMFVKRISDSFDEEREKIIEKFISQGKTSDEAKNLSNDPLQYDTFFVPEKSRWDFLKDIKHDIGASLNKATEAIEEVNEQLEGVLASIDFNDKDKLPDNKLRDLFSHFSKHRLRNTDFENDDLMGSAYEYLIKMFADSAGKVGGEFYTPNEIVKLLVHLIKPASRMRVYDPTCGSGGMLIQARKYLIEQGDDPRNISLFGQEMNQGTWAICKINMFLHSVFSADIKKGDTLRDPQHLKDGQLMVFDRVLANPPFSLDKWGKDEADNDPYGRYPYGTPPKGTGDLAFVQHMIASLNARGRLGLVVAHGVLYRGASEKKIREGIIKDDLLEAVIGLPSNLFYGTAIPAALMIINKEKKENKKNKIIFINHELEFQAKKNQNKLREKDIQKIVKTFDEYKDTKRYSKVVDLKEIEENDYNLNIRRYADTSPPPETFDTKGILNGGIPIAEVNEEYIQETLKGFDVSCVFNKKDNDYYIFKPEIKSKDQIKEFLNTNEQPIINQFERWWDKYKVSLNKLDAEVKKSEEVMRIYLKDLDYE